MNEKAPNKSPVWKILVVDDDATFTKAIKLMLECDGHDVQTANSGMEALTLLEKYKFDLVTTDYDMSGMKGDRLAVAIKERLPKQPILMIYSNGVHVFSGVDLALRKPFHWDELRNAIATVLP